MAAERERERERETAPEMVEVGAVVYCRRPRARGELHPGQLWLTGSRTEFASRFELVALLRLAKGPISSKEIAPYVRRGVTPEDREWRRQVRHGLARLHKRQLVFRIGESYLLTSWAQR